MAKYVTISVIVLIPAMTKHYFTHEDTHELFIKTGPVPTCGAVLNVHFDQMFVTASRKDDILKPQKNARKPFLFSSAVHVDMVDRKNRCDETHDISNFPWCLSEILKPTTL